MLLVSERTSRLPACAVIFQCVAAANWLRNSMLSKVKPFPLHSGHHYSAFTHGQAAIRLYSLQLALGGRHTRKWKWNINLTIFWLSNRQLNHQFCKPESGGRFLQHVSIACYAERCISYSKSVRPSVCLSVCQSVCQTALCQNDSSYDHAVFTGG